MKNKLQVFIIILLISSVIPLNSFAKSNEYIYDDYGMKEKIPRVNIIQEKSNWIEFDTKNEVPLEKEWTITFSGEVTHEKIDGMVIERNNEFIPVSIKLPGGNKATVTPVDAYEPNAQYSLKIFLNNGNRYRMNFNTKGLPIDYNYNRMNPAPIGVKQIVFVDNYSNAYAIEISVTELIRGDNAWTLIKSANMFNSEPGPGKEYILSKIKVKILSVNDDKKVNISPIDFDVFSEGNRKYNMVSVVTPDPSLRTDLYYGAEHEGYAAYLVDKLDSNPKIVYGQDYDGTGGVWFKLSK